MGAYVIVEFYFAKDNQWIGIALLLALVTFFIAGFYIYKKSDATVSIITEKELKFIKYLLYGYFAIYIIEIFLSNLENMNQEVLAIVTGIILMLTALVGIYTHYKILKVK
jgi:hypothetical protein